MLKISGSAASYVSNAILVTGSARSGTTIMGKVISSLARVEYVFEPPMLYTLFALIQSMAKEQWKLLYETYLYEEFLMNVLAGRTYNFNRADDSAIFRVKAMDEIEHRLDFELSKEKAEEIAVGHVIAYKMPDIVALVPAMQAYYPGTKVLVMLREAIGTINSILNKRWFSNDNANKGLIWPYREYKGLRIPYWVRQDEDDQWARMSELDRAAYYYICINEEVAHIANRIEVSYDQLLNEPRRTVNAVVEKLGLKFGSKTEEIVDQINPTTPERDFGIIDSISPVLRDKVKYYSNLSGSVL